MDCTTAHKINDAIRECLDVCYSTDRPLDALATYMAELQDSDTWHEWEIVAVEGAVLRLLRLVSRRPD